MMQLIRSQTRQFHVTSNTLLRKIVPRTFSGNEEPSFEKHKDLNHVIDSMPSIKESNSDYLGIESDEGAITVRLQKHSLPQDRTSGRAKEKFYRATYGVVRYDTENEPKFHGQYGKQMDFTFPYHSSDYVEVHSTAASSSDSQVLQKTQSFDTSEPIFFSKTEEDHSERVSCNEANEDLHYVDECYFGSSKIGNYCNADRSEKSTSDELNFVDTYYFGNENDTQLTSTAEHDLLKSGIHTTKSVDEKDDLTSCNDYTLSDLDNNNTAEKLTPNKINFDSNYFRNVNASKQLPIEKETFMASNISENKEFVFDKKDSQEAVSRCSTNISELDYKIAVNDNLSFSSNLTPNDSLKDNSVHSHLFENNMQKQVPLENNVQNVEKSLTESDYPMDSEMNEPEWTREFNQKISEQSSSQNNFRKSRSSSNRLRHELNLKKSVTQAKLESDSDSKKLFSEKNDFKYSKSTSEESNETEQVSTAHDFVAKLRKEQEVPKQSQQKAVTDKDTSTEKVDSKGFRILKNQVQSLSYFTRSEILNILRKNVVYSDDELIVLNKPYSLVIHESKTTKEPCLSMFLDDLAKEMDQNATNPKLFTVHRLDKETTGCLLLARNETMAQNLKALFAQRKIVKKYWIITIHVPDPVKGVIDMPISEGSINNRKRMVLHPKLPKDIPYKSHSRHGRPAITSYEVISESGNAALVEVTPVTGVKHQIRVHFGFGLGCPILGDHKYSHLDKLVPQKLPADILQKLHVRQSKVRHIPMHIHAKSVMIPNYFEGRNLFVNIPLPDYMIKNLKRMKFKK